MPSELSKELTLFIVQNVETVGQLEVLLLLFRQPQRSWKVAEIARELRGTPEATSSWLERWRSSGLIAADHGTFRYLPASRELEQVTADLARAFQTRPSVVAGCIHARPGLRPKR